MKVTIKDYSEEVCVDFEQVDVIEILIRDRGMPRKYRIIKRGNELELSVDGRLEIRPIATNMIHFKEE